MLGGRATGRDVVPPDAERRREPVPLHRRTRTTWCGWYSELEDADDEIVEHLPLAHEVGALPLAHRRRARDLARCRVPDRLAAQRSGRARGVPARRRAHRRAGAGDRVRLRRVGARRVGAARRARVARGRRRARRRSRRVPRPTAMPGDHPMRPTHATLALKAKEARSLVAWAGGGTPIVLAPHGFACTALVGADGGVHVRARTAGTPGRRPALPSTWRSRAACVGCIASVACGLFPRAAEGHGVRVPHAAPESRARRAPAAERARLRRPRGSARHGQPIGRPSERRSARSSTSRTERSSPRGSPARSTERRRKLPDILTDFLGAGRRALTA